MAVTKTDLTRQATNSGDVSWNSHKITSLQDPTSAQDAATKQYVDATAQGLVIKNSVGSATTGAESYTVAAGTVTQITGTTVDGVSPAINDRILIKDAPAATGAGSANSTQPGNGIYIVTNATTNLTISRTTDMSGAVNLPAGAFTFVEAGTTNSSAGFVVSVPATNTGFVYGTNNIKWTQFSGAGEITVSDGTLTKTGNDLKRTAITGDVAIAGASNVSVIGANKVTLGMQATLVANSVIGNSTGSTATPTAVPMVSTPTASSIAFRDASANLFADNHVNGAVTIATAAGTTTLTVNSLYAQQFTGVTTQTVVLPDGTTLTVGHAFLIMNRSTGVVTLNANGGGLVQTLAPGSQTLATLINNGSSAGVWDSSYALDAAGTVTAVSIATANGFSGSSSGGATPALTINATPTGVLKSNGTTISAASLGTDYLASSSVVTRETPSGTVNGSNTAFTLANTPTVGSEQVFLNGILQEPGAGNDYTISGTAITYLTAPVTGDRLRVTYLK